jgi:hypothetical protein
MINKPVLEKGRTAMRKITPIMLFLIVLLSACSSPTPTQRPPTVTPQPSLTPTPAPTEPLTVLETAEVIIQALSEQDLAKVGDFVHPEMGLRFSPYATIREDHLVFMAEDLPGLLTSDEVYTWGTYDGSGEPIELTFGGYYDEFVYSADFANPETVALNMRIGQGNTLNNIQDFYPSADFVEYHFSGFEEQYEGMDWESLLLVFVEESGVPYLVAIVHDQWTI